MKPDARIFVAGHRGMVGSAIARRLETDGHRDLTLCTHAELDLTDGPSVREFFADARPDYVFMAAAKVGGIFANQTYPADFIRENLAIELNVIDAAYRHSVTKLLFLGSSCAYPRDAEQPMTEDALLAGPLEPTNDAYALAKIAGIKMCEAYRHQYACNFISVMPTNLYGPGDDFNLETSHVLPAMIRRFHEAKERGDGSVTIWGTGSPKREFLHVDDLADACVFLMSEYDGEQHVNIGTGRDISILELAELVTKIVGFEGAIELDTSKPDGAPRKLLDVGRMTALGWQAQIGLREGIEKTYAWYRSLRQADYQPPESTARGAMDGMQDEADGAPRVDGRPLPADVGPKSL